jgi:hypothetical protein
MAISPSPASGLGFPFFFSFFPGILAILNLVIVPLLAVLCLLLPFLSDFVPDSDSSTRPSSKSRTVAEDSPCKSCEDKFGRYDRCQISDFAVVVDGAEIFRENKEVNVERAALGNQDKETLVENGVQVLPECDKVGNIGCRIGCGYRVICVLHHAITLILHCAD